ncbi:rhodanese-like domain-containing protein [Mariniflexile sp. HMF6888]|uniref:rhodanese-like domain-containing protein n=1 Tax=Mariniflexile sp. HMF6888 TaxID=3373086 RepID=UPI00378A9B92
MIAQEKKHREVIEQITVDCLDAIISENSYTIIDVRNPKGIEDQGSIPGAINIPFDTIDKHYESYNTIFNNEGPFLFCCTGGVMSYMAALKAQEKGIKNVFNLEGGHSAWKKLKKSEES